MVERQSVTLVVALVGGEAGVTIATTTRSAITCVCCTYACCCGVVTCSSTPLVVCCSLSAAALKGRPLLHMLHTTHRVLIAYCVHAACCTKHTAALSYSRHARTCAAVAWCRGKTRLTHNNKGRHIRRTSLFTLCLFTAGSGSEQTNSKTNSKKHPTYEIMPSASEQVCSLYSSGALRSKVFRDSWGVAGCLN